MKNRLLPLVIKYFGEGGLRPVACARGQLPHWRRQRGQGAQPPNGRAKEKGRGYFYQMSNMYTCPTCIAYLIEIRKFCSKNLVHKSVNFDAKNALKLTY